MKAQQITTIILKSLPMITNMKSRIIISISILLSLFLVSCITEIDTGYPKKVTFDSSGGTKEVSGNYSFVGFVIYKGEDAVASDIVPRQNDTIIAQYDWLYVEHVEKTIRITAKPNPDKTSRKLLLYCDLGPEYGEIKIRQEGSK